jgi:hypothetical protein
LGSSDFSSPSRSAEVVEYSKFLLLALFHYSHSERSSVPTPSPYTPKSGKGVKFSIKRCQGDEEELDEEIHQD